MTPPTERMGRGVDTILIVEDEADIRDVLEFVLENAGYRVLSTGQGDTALDLAREHPVGLAILDIGLPGMSGLEVCPHLVALDIPVLVLSSHDRDDQVVTGLEVGADDYVTKPFNHRELLLRVERILQRTRGARPSRILQAGPLTVDLERHSVTVRRTSGEVSVDLTPTEFDLVSFLAKNPGVPHTVETLLREVWRVTEWSNGEEMVKVGVRRLRKKIEEDPAHPKILLNRWGQGYFLTES